MRQRWGELWRVWGLCGGKLTVEGSFRVVSAPRPQGNSLVVMQTGRYYDNEAHLAMRPERWARVCRAGSRS